MTTIAASGVVYDSRIVCDLLDLPGPLAESATCDPLTLGRKDGFTFFDPGLSLVDQRNHAAVRGLGLLREQHWYDDCKWATQCERPCYRQVRIPIPGSTGRCIQEQERLVWPDEEMATTRVISALWIIHALATGQQALRSFYVRSCDTHLTRRHVVVGSGDCGNLEVCGYWDNYRRSDLGLAGSREC